MVGLFKNHADGTLFAAKIIHAEYSPEDKQLFLCSADRDDLIIPGMPEFSANDLIRRLFNEGKVDFTDYPAYLNEEPSPEEDENSNSNEPSNQFSLKNIFSTKHQEKSKDPWDI